MAGPESDTPGLARSELVRCWSQPHGCKRSFLMPF